MDTYRAQGAGGQHVNTTDSAVRIVHLPSGTVVQCQAERSQHKNKATAINMLKAKLYEIEQDKKRKAIDQLYSDKGDIAWGSQIRSYVMQPYTLVKDHRTDEQIGNVQDVLDGNIKRFIFSYLKNKNKISYVTQTTLSVDDTKEIALALNKKFPSIENPKKEDICYATTNRQEEVKRLVKNVDLMLVVGSENSSNSQRLVDVAKDSGCTQAHLIEDHKKIDWEKVAGASSIGITSGASAPDHLVKEVISSIQEKFDTSLVYDTTKKETIEFKVPLALR